jgi:hypothetical protein
MIDEHVAFKVSGLGAETIFFGRDQGELIGIVGDDVRSL